ncbi:TIM barrel protein [Nocardia terpenica]|uniref:2-keto-myo-inositol dehydratase n=1 Tax=Nocardia terpenica TaxID=455432 RepID=A0A164L0A9_9NOCA|nr:TIM barrel protein [Nocardia terpenica]KZM71902.1 2-keto-myo-inositol dehydratase [Nocardia terpenica]NQE86534.1 TIM barrel protein [Nocardia terpenica]
MTTTSPPHILGNLCLGSAPDSWGVWFADDEGQIPYTRFLDELVVAGYTWFELGPYGYLPTDPRRLAEEVDARGLRVSGGTTFGALHRPREWDDTVAATRRVAELTAAAGAHHLVFIPPMYRDEKTGAYTESPELTSEQWAGFGRRASELGKILVEEYGVRLVLHPHADSHIQSQSEIERYLNESDARYANLCLDTGHVAYGGGDAVDLIRRYGERIGYVHIKQMDPTVLDAVAAENLSFGEAVSRGVCVEPPAGVPDPVAVVEALSDLDADLFVIVEQDLYPCAPEVPLPIAKRTREFLNARGVDVPGSVA